MNQRSISSTILYVMLTLLPGVYATDELPKLTSIVVTGNKHITSQAVINSLPFKLNNQFDTDLSWQAMKNVYSLGYFSHVQLEQEKLSDQTVALHVIVKEKPLLGTVTFTGNKALKREDLEEKLGITKYATIDHEELIYLAERIEKIYREENYHAVKVVPHLIQDKNNQSVAHIRFVIQEGTHSLITRVFFNGNTKLSDHTLQGALFTREQWLLSFLDDAGKYDTEQLEMDKHRIEYFYRNHGYLLAKVTDVEVTFPNIREINVTFHIKEGPRFTIASVRALGDDIYTEGELLEYVLIKAGESYSHEKIIATIDRLKTLWGKTGFIYADVYPQIKPDEANNTVDITFHVERGEKLYVNRINITGNETTHDKVIRREITFEEGDLLTTTQMSQSQSGVEYLGFFQPGGVNWKIHRLTDDLADVELHVREAKTGGGSLSMTYGSDRNTPTRSLKGVAELHKRNIFGMGWDGRLMVKGDRRHFREFAFSFFDPYLLDTNLSAGLNFYLKRDDYEQWKSLSPTPVEKIIGGSMRLGFLLPSIDKRLYIFSELGTESLRNNSPKAHGNASPTLQLLVDRTFQSGTLTWLGLDIIKDDRNHKVYPNSGSRIALLSRFAPPVFNQQFSMIKSELEASWYTPLIGQDKLVLALHGRAGLVRRVWSDNIIPYKELFHMGGQSTVRGFNWGSIGPAFKEPGTFGQGEPLGGRNAVQFNAELIFPLLADYSLKAHLFYDAGAAWSTPKNNIDSKDFIIRDKFDLRHSIGIGLNFIYPQPIKIAWGYKLDRRRELGESRSEWHISMNTAW